LADVRRAEAVEVPPPVPAAPAPSPALPTLAAPTGVADAQAHPDWVGPEGWRASLASEVHKVYHDFHALKVVPASEFHEATREHGRGKVTMAFLLVVFKIKTGADGLPVQGPLARKSRIAVSDPNADQSGVETYAPCADEATGHATDQLALALGLKSVSLDAKSAYLNGIRPTIADGGRLIFAPIPKWLHLFIPTCPGPDSPDFKRFMLRIDGNMPGIAEAGRIWHTHFVKWLVEPMGMIQSIVDPCIFSRVLDGGLDILMIRIHVDDGRVHYSIVASMVAFRDKFITAFGSSADLAEESEAFTGVRFRVVSSNVTEVTCPGVLERLAEVLADFPLPDNVRATYPLPANASLKLREGPGVDNPLADDKVPAAQVLGGLAGFVVVKVRFDGLFGYMLLAPYLRVGKLTERCFGYLVRLCHYLVRTCDLPLILTATVGRPFSLEGLEAFLDSSHGNDEDGKSLGGFALFPPGGGGALAVKVVSPTKVTDSSGSAELVLATIALKYTLAILMLYADLRLSGLPLQAAPRVPFWTDASAIIDGVANERITKQTRWMAARKAMLRSAVSKEVISLRKVSAEDNVADILTKPLTGPAFERHRHTLLGLGLLSAETRTRLPADFRTEP